MNRRRAAVVATAITVLLTAAPAAAQPKPGPGPADPSVPFAQQILQSIPVVGSLLGGGPPAKAPAAGAPTPRPREAFNTTVSNGIG